MIRKNFDTSNPPRENAKISPDGSETVYDFEHIELTTENPKSEPVSFEVEKLPIHMTEGGLYAQDAVELDKNNDLMDEIQGQAEELKNIPEKKELKRFWNY